MLPGMPTEVVALGDRAIRFARPAGVPSRALHAAILRWPGVAGVVIARAHVAVYFAGVRDASVDDQLAHRIARLAELAELEAPPREVELAATYDGEDLDAVARATGLSVDEVVRIHADTTYAVDTLGFAPGFAYLVGLDPRLHVPRRATPRPRVPAGALAIAAEYTAVYPFASPGGWHLMGRVAGAMYDEAGARLHLGDRVRFVR